VTITVQCAARENRADIEAVAQADPRTLIYSSPMFTDFLSFALGIPIKTLIARDDGKPSGILHYAELEGTFGRVINSLPWYGTHGGCVCIPSAPSQVRSALLEEFKRLTAEEDVLTSCLVMSPHEEPLKDFYVQKLEPEATDERIGMFCPLLASDDEQLTIMHQKTRNLVRKSLKLELDIRSDDSIEAWNFLITTHKANLDAIGGVAKPRQHFEALRATIPLSNRELLIASRNGEPVAALLTLRFNETVEYLVPAVQVEHRSTQAMSRLIWEGMRRAAAAGYAWWNWGGTWKSQESLLRFKSRWGGVALPYSYLINCSEENRKTIVREAPGVFASHEFFYLYPRNMLNDAG